MCRERGNALFLILIAVALFAALSYAITQSGRGAGNADKEQNVIRAAQITQYATALRTTVLRMTLGGVASTAVTFDTGTAHSVFDSAGGGMVDTPPPAGIGGLITGGPLGGPGGSDPNAWGYKDMSDPALGYYIATLGSDADVAGRDSFAYLRDISLSVCQALNRGLGLALTPIPVHNVDYGLNAGAGLGSYNLNANVFGVDWAADAPTGAAFACVLNGDTVGDYPYDYYHALIEQ